MARADAVLNFTAVDRTRAVFDRVRRNVRGVTSQLASFKSAVFAAAGIGGIGALVKSSLDSVDALAKTSDKLGVTVNALQGLQQAAELTGVSSNQLNTALQRFTRRTAEAGAGTGAAKDAFTALGLSAQELSQLAPDVAFARVADAFQNVQSQSERVALAFKLFDSEGVGLVNTLALGSEGLREISRELDEFGIALTRVEASRIEEANDSFTRLRSVFGGVADLFSAELAGFLTAFTHDLLTSAKESGGFRDAIKSAFDTIINLAAVVVGAFNALRTGFATLRAAVLTWASVWIGSFAKAVNFVGDAISSIRRFFGQTVVESENFITALAGDFAAKAEEARGEAAQLAATVFSSAEAFGARLREIQARNAELVESERSTQQQITAIRDEEEKKRTENEAIRAAERNAARLARLQEEFLTEREQLVAQFNERQAIVDQAVQLGNVKEQEAANIRTQLAQQLESQLTAINQKGQQDRVRFQDTTSKKSVNNALGDARNLLSGISENNKKLFAVQKTLGIANALISAHEGAAKTLGQYPWPVGPALAALHYAAGLARVAAIRSTSFGGGGGGFGGGGATIATPAISTPAPTPAIAGAPAQEPTQIVDITLEGRAYSRDEIVDLIGELNDAVGDGVNLTATVTTA